MSASNEVRFKIGGDTSALSRAFIQAQSIAAAAGKQLHKKLGLQDAFKSTVLALGISIDKIAEKIANVFSGGSGEQWEAALSAAENTSRIIEEAMFNRLSLLKQIAALEARIAQNKPNEDPTPRGAGELTGFKRAMFDSPGGRKVMAALGLGGETEAEAETRSSKTRGKNAADEAKREELKERAAKNEERIASAQADLRRSAMDDDEQIIAMIEEMNAAYDKLSEAVIHEKDTTELHLAALAKQKAAVDAIKKAEKDRADAARAKLEDDKRQAEERVRSAEQALETADRIREIEDEAATLGETTGEKIARLKREAVELDKKAADQNRSEDNRNQLRVQAAEKRAEAAKTEYEWKNKTANIDDSLNSSNGKKNTTGQGILANRAARAADAARKARAQGRFGEAVKQEGIAREATEEFQKRDRSGMEAASAPAAPASAWDAKYGAQLKARNDAITNGVAARNRALTRSRTGQAEEKQDAKKEAAMSPEAKLLKEARDSLKKIEEALKPKETK